MIPEAAVEAAAAKMPPIWTGSPAYRANLVQALEAAAPHMLAGVEEFGIFRKGGDWHDAPMEKWTFTTRERAECAIRKFNDGESWLEVRSRIAAPWTVAE